MVLLSMLAKKLVFEIVTLFSNTLLIATRSAIRIILKRPVKTGDEWISLNI
jgi:hypothetical protein